jgi:hypothetical protein
MTAWADLRVSGARRGFREPIDVVANLCEKIAEEREDDAAFAVEFAYGSGVCRRRDGIHHRRAGGITSPPREHRHHPGIAGMLIVYGVAHNPAVAAVLLHQAIGLLVPLVGGGIAYMIIRRRLGLLRTRPSDDST